MADTVLEELLVSTEVQTARDRLEDYDNAEQAANHNPSGEQELASLRDALVEMPGAVRMLLPPSTGPERTPASRSTTRAMPSRSSRPSRDRRLCYLGTA